MLSSVEFFSRFDPKTFFNFSSLRLPLEVYEKHIDFVDWEELLSNPDLTLEFFLKHLTKEKLFELCCQSEVPVSLFLQEYFLEQCLKARQSQIYWNKLIPDSFFTVIDEKMFAIHGRKLKTLNRKLVDEFPNSFDVSLLKHEFIPSLFNHSDLTLELAELHLQQLLQLENSEIEFTSPVMGELFVKHYPLYAKTRTSLFSGCIPIEFLDAHPELIRSYTFYRSNLPIWFTDKYREKMAMYYNCRLSRTTLAYLKRKRDEIWLETCPWIPLLDLYQPFHFPKKTYLLEKLFIRQVKETVSRLLN